MDNPKSVCLPGEFQRRGREVGREGWCATVHVITEKSDMAEYALISFSPTQLKPIMTRFSPQKLTQRVFICWNTYYM